MTWAEAFRDCWCVVVHKVVEFIKYIIDLLVKAVVWITGLWFIAALFEPHVAKQMLDFISKFL